jgi:hypothetical protein
VISIRIEGLDRAITRVRDLNRQIRFASARALNEHALLDQRPALQAEMETRFDRPTPFIKQSLWVDRAEPQRPEVKIYPRYPGGKGVDPANVLRPEVQGGTRRAKRAERALQRIGVLPPGWFMVPGSAAPRDAYGNVPGSFIVRVLSYLQAFGEQGYRANMTARNRSKLSGKGRWVNGRFVPEGARGAVASAPRAYRKGGVEYFVSRGKGTWGAMPHQGRQGRRQHLPPGIWARSGVYGESIKPIFLFVRATQYRVRYPMGEIARGIAQAHLPRRLQASLQHALRTAR